MPTFSLSYCKFLKGNPVEYLTRDFEAFDRTLHFAGITGDFEAFSNNLHMASITCGFEAFSKKSHIRQVLLATLKPSLRPGENYLEGESLTTTLFIPPHKKKQLFFIVTSIFDWSLSGI